MGSKHGLQENIVTGTWEGAHGFSTMDLPIQTLVKHQSVYFSRSSTNEESKGSIGFLKALGEGEEERKIPKATLVLSVDDWRHSQILLESGVPTQQTRWSQSPRAENTSSVVGHSRAGKVSMFEKWTEPPSFATRPIWLLAILDVSVQPDVGCPSVSPDLCIGCFLWLKNTGRI